MSQINDLISEYKEMNRDKFALEWKRNGGRVVGYLDSYIPEEIIHAAGILPWRVIGTMQGFTPLGSVYRPKYTSLHCLHVLENFLGENLNFLNGMVMTDWDDDHTRLWDQLRFLMNIKFCPILHIPQIKTSKSINFFTSSLQNLKADIENAFQVSIDENALKNSIAIYNETRELLNSLFALRRKYPSLLKMSDYLRLIDLSTIMPKEDYNKKLASAIKEVMNSNTNKSISNIEEDKKNLIYLSSEWLDDISFIELLESTNVQIAMDDLNNGTRYFSGFVNRKEKPLNALAERYLEKEPCPRMAFWPEYIKKMIEKVINYNIRGILNFPEIYSWPRRIYNPFFQKACFEQKIPTTTILRSYQLSNEGQIRTRLEAFLETIEER